jgi:hypothetical protein
MMPFALASAFPVVMLTALFVSLATPIATPITALAPGSPPTGIRAGACDFGRIGENLFRCGRGAGIVIELSDGKRYEVPGPLNISFGTL